MAPFAKFCLENPETVRATLSLTMTLSEWKQLQKQLGQAWPSWELSAAITDMISTAQKHFKDEHEYNG